MHAGEESVAESAEEASEDVAETAEVFGSALVAAGGDAALLGVYTVGVVAAPPIGVTEDGVGFGDLFELVFGFGVVGVDVGMVLARELAVRRLDLLVVGAFWDAEDRVVILCHSPD